MKTIDISLDDIQGPILDHIAGAAEDGDTIRMSPEQWNECVHSLDPEPFKNLDRAKVTKWAGFSVEIADV